MIPMENWCVHSASRKRHRKGGEFGVKRTISFLLTAVLLLSLLACGAKDAWQEQYDLGMRYLNDGNYQEAVITFTAAIEIDPKRPEAYLGAAEAYIAADDIDAAIAILEKGYAATNDDTLKKRLDEIRSGTFNDYWGRARRKSSYDENGALVWYHLYTYDAQGRIASATSYDATGNQTNHVDYEYDESGNTLVWCGCEPDNGTLVRVESIYGADDLVTKETSIRNNGSMSYRTYQYDQNGYCVRMDMYTEENVLTSYYTYENNEEGKTTKRIHYDADGKNLGYGTYAYNDAGAMTECCSYSSDGHLVGREILYYDTNGHYTGSEAYDGEGNLLSSTSYQD